ncbi:hypothetical protein GGR76_001023 [Xanthomonas translucens]|nr:hypothetical protein [Xanthomonas campestris]
MRSILEVSASAQRDIAPALRNTGKPQIRLAAGTQVARSIELAAAVDGRSVQANRTGALEHRSVGGGERACTQTRIAADRTLRSKGQRALRLQVQRVGGLQATCSG